jgi:hypothetical protein
MDSMRLDFLWPLQLHLESMDSSGLDIVLS